MLLSGAPRLLLNATRQSGKSTAAALKAAWTVLQSGLAVVVSPSLRQSGFLFRKLTRHLIASDASFRRETLTEVELVSGGLAVSLPGDHPAMLRGLSLRHDGPAVLIVDEASRVRDELWTREAGYLQRTEMDMWNRWRSRTPDVHCYSSAADRMLLSPIRSLGG